MAHGDHGDGVLQAPQEYAQRQDVWISLELGHSRQLSLQFFPMQGVKYLYVHDTGAIAAQGRHKA